VAPAEASTAVALLGDVQLDLTEAEVEHAELAITTIAALGDVVIVVPAGVESSSAPSP
jgi:predicted membrane protein